MPTHGALTKAGKVRNQTPKIAATEKKPGLGPRRRNLRQYQKMLKTPENGGNRRRRRRRR